MPLKNSFQLLFFSKDFSLKYFSLHLKTKAFVGILDGGYFIFQMEQRHSLQKKTFSRLNNALFANVQT